MKDTLAAEEADGRQQTVRDVRIKVTQIHIYIYANVLSKAKNRKNSRHDEK